MNNKARPDVDDAYALETPEDNARLYKNWAETYDEDFVLQTGYQSYVRIAEIFVAHFSRIGAVLDVGCGTGVVGVELRRKGVDKIDGVDISDAMLAKAGEKTVDGAPAYRDLISADLTQNLDIPDAKYSGLISAGTFTHGHLGPEVFNELWRVAAPGATCALGIRTSHYHAADFARKLAADTDSGIISDPQMHEIDIYESGKVDPQHAGDKAYVVVCRVLN